jgi:hypothetical protein
MSTLDVPVSATRNRFKSNGSTPKSSTHMNVTPRTAISGHVHTSSLERVQAELRSPRSRTEAEYPADDQDAAVEMSLLGNGHPSQVVEDDSKDKDHKPLSKKDKNAMTLLIILCKSFVNVYRVAAY